MPIGRFLSLSRLASLSADAIYWITEAHSSGASLISAIIALLSEKTAHERFHRAIHPGE